MAVTAVSKGQTNCWRSERGCDGESNCKVMRPFLYSLRGALLPGHIRQGSASMPPTPAFEHALRDCSRRSCRSEYVQPATLIGVDISARLCNARYSLSLARDAVCSWHCCCCSVQLAQSNPNGLSVMVPCAAALRWRACQPRPKPHDWSAGRLDRPGRCQGSLGVS